MFDCYIQGAVHVIHGDLALTREHVEKLDELLDTILQDGYSQAVFDMSKIPLADSAGLEKLLDLKEALRNRGGNLRLAAAGPLLRDIFHSTGMDGRFEVYDRVTDAVGSYVR